MALQPLPRPTAVDVVHDKTTPNGFVAGCAVLQLNPYMRDSHSLIPASRNSRRTSKSSTASSPTSRRCNRRVLVSRMWRNGLVCHPAVAMVAWPKSLTSTIRPSFHVSEYARRNGCSPAMDRKPRAIGTPAAANRPQNPSNSVFAATSLVPASMSQACSGTRLGLNDGQPPAEPVEQRLRRYVAGPGLDEPSMQWDEV